MQDGAVQVVVDGLERGSAQEAIVQFADACGHLGLAEAMVKVASVGHNNPIRRNTGG